MSKIVDVISSFNPYQTGGKVIGAIPMIMTLYLILYCLLLPALYCAYRKTEIKINEVVQRYKKQMQMLPSVPLFESKGMMG